MPEQSVHHREDADEQQTYNYRKIKGETYENNRHECTGRIQCRN